MAVILKFKFGARFLKTFVIESKKRMAYKVGILFRQLSRYIVLLRGIIVLLLTVLKFRGPRWAVMSVLNNKMDPIANRNPKMSARSKIKRLIQTDSDGCRF